MATTTNYGWTTPDDTALVKDGAAAIRTLGSSVDTTTKNLNPSTTLGDIEYRSSTANVNTRLGIGTTGQILTVAGGVPSWATPASGSGLTFISRTVFSNQTSQALDGIFTSTYDNYIIVVEDFFASTSSDDFQMQLRYAGPTTETGNVYNGNSLTTDRSNTTITNIAMNDVGQYTFANVSGAGSNTQASTIILNFSNVGNANENARWHGTGHIGETNYGAVFFGGAAFATRTYTGILLKSSSSNVSGIATVYGLAKS